MWMGVCGFCGEGGGGGAGKVADGVYTLMWQTSTCFCPALWAPSSVSVFVVGVQSSSFEFCSRISADDVCGLYAFPAKH